MVGLKRRFSEAKTRAWLGPVWRAHAACFQAGSVSISANHSFDGRPTLILKDDQEVMGADLVSLLGAQPFQWRRPEFTRDREMKSARASYDAPGPRHARRARRARR